MKWKSTDLAGGKIVTNVNRISPGVTVLVLGLLTLGFFGWAFGQEMTDQERRERCQNNLNRQAELEQEMRPIENKVLEAEKKGSRIKYLLDHAQDEGLGLIRAIQEQGIREPNTGYPDLDRDIMRTWNNRLPAAFLSPRDAFGA
jgi:hypothetical protein